MIDLILASVALALAALPALLTLRNLWLYQKAPAANPGEVPAVSVLIPARNEAQNIVEAVHAALASKGVTLEVVVLDDHSEDATAALVAEIACRDRRVRLLSAPPLPPGWCGKPYACHVMASTARFSLLCFLDADVQLQPDGLARLCAFHARSGVDLVSGVPRQETGTLLERLVIPLIHFVLLGFLPMAWMRKSARPAYAAGCGQLLLADREAYNQVGGHAAVRTTMHDGVKLTRAFRTANKKTDLCDASDLTTCRMYRGAGEVWHGLAKNATEGLASPAMIVPASLLLLGGQVLPVVLLAWAPWLSPAALMLAVTAAVLAYATRLAGAIRFRESLLGAALHPLGVMLLVAIQWYALGSSLLGRPLVWKGRTYSLVPFSPTHHPLGPLSH